MGFKGWLLKFGDTVLPNEYLEEYNETPNQRMEIDSYRDTATVKLRRTTSPYYKTKLEIPIRQLYYGEKVTLKAILDAATENVVERKVRVTYWNSELMDYATGDFYIPDIKYTVSRVDPRKLNMVYRAFTLVLIEY